MSKIFFIVLILYLLLLALRPSADPLCSEATRLYNMEDAWNASRFQNLLRESRSDQWFQKCFPKIRNIVDNFRDIV